MTLRARISKQCENFNHAVAARYWKRDFDGCVVNNIIIITFEVLKASSWKTSLGARE